MQSTVLKTFYRNEDIFPDLSGKIQKKVPSRVLFLYRLLTVKPPPIQRLAAGGDFTLKVSVHNGRLRRPGVSPPGDGDKRGRDTKVSYSEF